MFIAGKELSHQDHLGITATSQLNPLSLGRKTRERDVLIKARGAGLVKHRLLLLPKPSKTEGAGYSESKARALPALWFLEV